MNDDEVPIPNEAEMELMGIPSPIAPAVRQELEQTPPDQRVTMGQIQDAARKVIREKLGIEEQPSG